MPRFERRSWGAVKITSARLRESALIIPQQLLCRKERVKRITLRNQLGASFFTVDDGKGGDHFVTGLFGPIRRFQNRISRRTNIIHNDHSRAPFPVITFNGPLGAMALGFLA